MIDGWPTVCHSANKTEKGIIILCKNRLFRKEKESWTRDNNLVSCQSCIKIMKKINPKTP
jgi:hypothetical protein